jgi:MoxR-like ATPase
MKTPEQPNPVLSEEAIVKPVQETETSVSYLGVTLEKAEKKEGRFVPKREQYKDYINEKFSLDLQKKIAISFLAGDPVLIEGGTSIGKTTTIKKMCAELGWEVHYANLNGATDVQDLMGRYIPNPFKLDRTKISDEKYEKIISEWTNHTAGMDPTLLEGKEYIFADGKVTSGLRQEEGKVKVIILDEFNASAPNILIRLHEVLDALERGGDVTLSEDASEVVPVSKGKTKIIALMNPPGKGYFGREPLDPAQLRRWVYQKEVTELPDETFSFSTKALFGIQSDMQEIPEDLYLKPREQILSDEQLQEIPGIEDILTKYEEFHKAVKELVAKRKIATDQPQPFTYDDRAEPRRVRDFVLRFYTGDLNETFQEALRYYYRNKLESDEDKKKISELIDHVMYVPKEETKRKGTKRKSDEKAKEAKPENQGEAKEKTEAEELLGKTEEEIKVMKTVLRKKRKEILGESSDSVISAEYKRKDEKGKVVKENIEIDFQEKLDSAVDFYKKHGIKLPADFTEQIQDIWQRNVDSMKEAIEKQGFDEVLFVPSGLAVPDLHTKMSAGYIKTYQGSNFESNGSFSGVKEKTTESRIILIHKNNAQNLANRPELKETLGKTAESFVKSGEAFTLTDYLIYQKKYFEETGKHLDVDGWTWLPGSRVGSYVVCAYWDPDDGQLSVHANTPGSSYPFIGCRPSRCFQ